MKKKRPKKQSKDRRLTTLSMPPILQKNLAATDFSKESQAGVCYALALAEELKASVSLLHVIEPPSRLSGLESVILACSDPELVNLARKQLTTLAKREEKGEVAVTASVRTGKAFHVKHVWLGSTAERVVRHAPFPVLVVRELEHELI